MVKKLGRFDVFSLVIGSIIGWGSFTLPGKQFLSKSGVINTTIGLATGGILVMLIQVAYHKMLEKNTEEGGEFSYAFNELGKLHGFIVGWSLSLCYLSMIPLNASAYVLLFRVIFGEKYNFGYLYSVAGYSVYISDILLMSSIIIIFAYINIKGLRVSSKVQNVMSLCLVSIVFLLIIFVGIKSDMTIFRSNYIENYKFSLKEISSVIAIVPFLFVGFDVIPQVAKELKFKVHKATILALISIVCGVFIYAGLNLIAGFSFSPTEAAATNWAVADSVISKLGYIGFSFMLVALWAAVTGGINGFMIASSKLIASLSKKDIMDKKYSKKNKNDVYPYAIVFVSTVSLIAPWIGREVILYIVDMASVLAAVAYGYVSYISFKYANKKFEKILCFIAIIISISFILLLLLPISPAMLDIPALIFLIIWLILGVIIYNKKKIVSE
ncbi:MULTISPECIES: APC family permease [Gemella]|uniref:APC family permease n=1 Tax=Gemella TaxID=1378 RepID=UPI0007682302|nr:MULTISPECIES: APC family permease [Gemella]AME09331.1 amino acid ABC transporter permease [Gemella sp. oral taxon 928]AXI26966.1 APC family permease [Gemella sp. ND 6198]